MLFRLAGLAIMRHTKVRSDANPFDPAWTAYFQHRANALRLRCNKPGPYAGCWKA
jgi:hypothetical protein